MITAIIIALGAALVCFVLIQAMFHAFRRRTAVDQRIVELKRQGPGLGDGSSDPLDPNYNPNAPAKSAMLTLEPQLSPFAEGVQALLAGFGINVAKYRKTHGMDFYRAGFDSADSPVLFLAYKWFLAPLLAVWAGYLIFFARQPDGSISPTNALMGIIIGVAAIWGPKLILNNNRMKREKRLVNSFPDALDLLLVCVETGLALDGALARVTRELGQTAPDITAELNRTRLELSLLNDRQTALLNLASRTNLAAFKTLVGALLQSERMGTSLTDTLRVLSEDYRMRRLMDAETRAGRLPAIITIPLVLFMLPALFLVILGPAGISLTQSFSKGPVNNSRPAPKSQKPAPNQNGSQGGTTQR